MDIRKENPKEPEDPTLLPNTFIQEIPLMSTITTDQILDYKTNLCYKYDHMRQANLTAKQFVDKEIELEEASKSLNRLSLKHNVYVGLVMPRRAPSGK